MLPNPKSKPENRDISKIVHCVISATNYLLFGLKPQLSKITGTGLEVNIGLSKSFSEYSVSRDGRQFTEYSTRLRGQEKIFYFIYVD